MKILKIVLKVIYNTIFILLFISATFIILTSYKVINGYNFYVVMSGSMEPKIHTGSIVGVKENSEYNIDDVITIKMENDPSQTYTHRIKEINKDENENITYTTKGDANETEDPDKADKDLVIGKVFISIPLIGYIINFAKQPTGFILMIVVPSIIIIASELNTIKEEGIRYLNNNRKKINSEKENDEE